MIAVPIILGLMIGRQMDDDRQLRRLALEWLLIGGAVWRVTRATMEARLQEQGIELSGLQVHVLKILQFEGAQTLSDISRKMVIDPSTLVPTVDTLERKGYVVRQRDQQDRRRVNISLSEKGLTFVSMLDTVNEGNPIYQGFQAMGLETANHLVSLMRQLMTHLPDGTQALVGVDQYLCSIHLAQNEAERQSLEDEQG